MPAYKGEYEDVLRPFLDAMRHKLASSKHRGKRKWQEVPLGDLLKLLKGEIVELEEAIAGGNTVEMLLEAADVGNFAMMVANVAIQQAAGNTPLKNSVLGDCNLVSGNGETHLTPPFSIEDPGHEAFNQLEKSLYSTETVFTRCSGPLKND